MRISVCLLVLFLPSIILAQVYPNQQKSLNAYIEYANQSADEVIEVVNSIIEYYPKIGSKNSVPRYGCPFQLDSYYATNAENQKQILGTASTSISTAFGALQIAAQNVDQKCKALDTYHKLEDYRQDNFASARTLVNDLMELVADYRRKKSEFQTALKTAYDKLASTSPSSYRQADARMLATITSERNFIDSWKFNLKSEVHTGWSVEKLQQSISESDRQLTALKNITITLKYPASTMWTQFHSSLSSILEVKRRALDEYNFEARKSDRHSNEIYLELINYFNGTLVSDYNTFIQFAERDGYHGLKTIKYVPAFEIRLQAMEVDVKAEPFKDIPRTPLKITPAKTPVNKTVFESLTFYVDFINETWRQTRYMQSVLTSFNSTASYFKTLQSYDKRAPMHFDYSDFNLPLSDYQRTIAASTVLSSDHAKSLNEQTEVLLNILKEMDDLSASVDIEVKEKKYEQDHLKNVYNILERQKELFKIWDDKKEILYQDVRALFNSYPPADASGSWQISGKALRELADMDREALFMAKMFYTGDSTIKISTDDIDHMVRNIISNEYDNMKGIQKIGRNNGLCPYTPYEDLPQTSKQLSEHFKKLKPAASTTGYSHPYHSMVYLYNEIVDDYNKFCTLSTVTHHLKTVKQPELFTVKYPEENSTHEPSLPDQASAEEKSVENAVPSEREPKKPIAVSGAEKNTVIRDTIYIEKRDTIYLSGDDEDLRSMEGYATNNMILLLDVSGSMNQPEKLPLLKQSMLDMLSMMRTEDRITIIAFSGKPEILLKPTSFREEVRIRKAVENLSSSGKTDGNAALKLAYKVADQNYLRGGNNRIILATDGEFIVNDEIQQLIQRFSDEDIFLTVFNFSKGAGLSRNLEKLATLGKGNYEAISKENVELKLIREAKAKRKK